MRQGLERSLQNKHTMALARESWSAFEVRTRVDGEEVLGAAIAQILRQLAAGDAAQRPLAGGVVHRLAELALPAVTLGVGG